MKGRTQFEALGGEVVSRDDKGNPDLIMVESDSGGDPYAVRWAVLRVENEETTEESYISSWVCNCKAYEYGRGKPCKHIKRVIPEPFIVDLSEQTGNE
jgi:adenine specific DNA methylase Mod